MSCRYEVVEIHGLHESMEGLCIWGYGVWDRDRGKLLERMHPSREQANEAVRRLDPYGEAHQHV